MQPAELVAIMAAIIYSGRRDQLEEVRPETRQAAVEEAWQLWRLTMDELTDPGIPRLEAARGGACQLPVGRLVGRLDRPMMEP